MEKLNLPQFKCRIRRHGNKEEIFDPVRKRFVTLTPEEWVRQHFLNYLVHHKQVPETLIAVEKILTVNQLPKRTDIVVYNNLAQPVTLVECKSPNVKITQGTFDQVVRYNMSLKVIYIMVTNGMEHYCCKINYSNQSYVFIQEIPGYPEW
jgi:hypothetical protein